MVGFTVKKNLQPAGSAAAPAAQWPLRAGLVQNVTNPHEY
jgi:hypothetical protein